MTEAEERQHFVAVARSYVGTPYHDCGQVKGHGVDCATLMALALVEAGFSDPIALPAYSPQWYLHREAEVYMSMVLERMVEIDEADVLPGDVILYKFGHCFAHGAIVTSWPAVVHAYKQAGRVVEGEGLGGPLGLRPRRFFRLKRWAAR